MMKLKTRIAAALAVTLAGTAFMYGIVVITRIKTENVPHEIEEPSYEITLNAAHAESVLAVVNAESFDEAFRHYSTYRDIPDAKFHELRRAYINAADELMIYLVKAAGNAPELPYYMRYENRN
jgi:hypothetical protein